MGDGKGKGKGKGKDKDKDEGKGTEEGGDAKGTGNGDGPPATPATAAEPAEPAGGGAAPAADLGELQQMDANQLKISGLGVVKYANGKFGGRKSELKGVQVLAAEPLLANTPLENAGSVKGVHLACCPCSSLLEGSGASHVPPARAPRRADRRCPERKGLLRGEEPAHPGSRRGRLHLHQHR